MKKTVRQKMIQYMNRRVISATAKEIAKGAKCNPNTVRKELGKHFQYDQVVRCKETGRPVFTYIY